MKTNRHRTVGGATALAALLLSGCAMADNRPMTAEPSATAAVSPTTSAPAASPSTATSERDPSTTNPTGVAANHDRPTLAEERACPRDPHPCGGEWPDDLVGHKDFELERIDEVRVVAHDGIALHGWVVRPRVPPGVKVPTVLSSSPYYDSVAGGTVYRNPMSPLAARAGGADGWLEDTEPPPFDVETHSAGFPPVRLLRKGYALAYFSVRGTGHSEGCFDGGGALDEADQVAIIDWIERQPWSNRRVGMVGLSAPSRSSWQAAVAAPKALKTIITAGDLIDLYQWVHTPQGSNSLLVSNYYGTWSANLALTSGVVGAETGIADRTGCDPGRFERLATQSLVTGERDARYYTERSLALRLGNIQAAVLDTSGYFDLAGHYGQDSTIWSSLPAKTPKVAIRGYWGHDHPTPWNAWATRLNFPSGLVDWEQYVTGWLDYWLKGVGPEPRTEVIYHQDQNLAWHEASSWSPAPKAKEVLYLSKGGLSTTPTAGDVTFLSAPSPLDADWAEDMADSLTSRGIGRPHDQGLNPGLCPSPLDAGLSHAYLTPAASSPVLLAGNPFAFLDVSSDQPGGVVTVSMYDVGPAFTCDGSHVTGARYIASGSADLNFHETPFLAREFPVGRPTNVRIDLSDTTYALAAGHRLAVVVSNGGPYERSGSLATPNITIHGVRGATPAARASHLVVPVAGGTLGGDRPSLRYPSRPFTPPGYED